MISKNYSKTKKSCRVTFRYTTETEVDTIQLLGEFNQWGKDGHDLKKRKDGTYSVTLSLKAGQDYRFRYLIDGNEWQNDENADNYVYNPFGTKDAVLSV